MNGYVGPAWSRCAFKKTDIYSSLSHSKTDNISFLLRFSYNRVQVHRDRMCERYNTSNVIFLQTSYNLKRPEA
ncbi:hypothetical protein H206_07591 [Candidatus Electrothrix aarhusensis]|uniref:Uncharacterized protein n=1 Tax=Candidatus Electrothrix aarhusensis TaxID=1859131 RepID=A0A3S3QTH8_9BACT|nr:hypothetical protein H206_07591 [Candidatus Electrothrix aarhusensis]